MYRLVFFPLIFIVSFNYGQSRPDSSSNDIQSNVAKSNQLIAGLMDATLHPMKYAKTLEEFLLATFPRQSPKDGRWVYYNKQANLERIVKPQLAKLFPEEDFYSVNLTNYLGYHINRGTCIIMFDSVHSKLTFFEPLWYGGVSEPLLKKFIGLQFHHKDTLLSLLTELNELMQIGSGYKFKQTSFSDSLITYDLGYFKGASYTTGGNGISSTVNYNEDGVWRKIKIEIKDLTIIRYTSTNPKMNNDKQIIE